MKLLTKLKLAVVPVTSFALLLATSSCNNNTDGKCCAGYTGKVTNEQSLALVNKCHFLSKDSIEMWTGKYEAYKKRLGGDQDTIAAAMDKMAAGFLRGGSVSFNSCIIRKIIANEKSIGLRVLYGIGADNRIHIILVGINADDYSNLYVSAEDCCDKPVNKSLANGAGSATGSSGGAEYGQMP
ncbi:MAG: hypothetical protein JNM14_10145 [Ferruginibacter sp.]|nr:hypothetical protein [Ferruginibacter sp.]